MAQTNEQKIKQEKVMERYHHWLNKVEGYTRSTMERNKYNFMLKSFSEHGLKRTNFVLSVKDHPSKMEYEKARCAVMKAWRSECWKERDQ